MEALVARCAGLDVHKETVAVCVLVMGEDGKVTKTVRTYGTMTSSLLALSDWLAGWGVTDVAMEATGGCIGSRSTTSWRAGLVCCWSTRRTSRKCRGARPT